MVMLRKHKAGRLWSVLGVASRSNCGPTVLCRLSNGDKHLLVGVELSKDVADHGGKVFQPRNPLEHKRSELLEAIRPQGEVLLPDEILSRAAHWLNHPSQGACRSHAAHRA